MSDHALFEWLSPWHAVEETATARRTFPEQLARETGPGHPLHGIAVTLVARGDGDDALFALLDGSGRVAEVHLVWQGAQRPPWPRTTVFASLEAWRVVRMIPDHADPLAD